MSNTTVCNVNDIQGDKKACLEGLLGQPLRDDQQVFIMVFTPGIAPEAEARTIAAARIVRTLDGAEQDAAARGITADEADAAVNEAMERIRRRRP